MLGLIEVTPWNVLGMRTNAKLGKKISGMVKGREGGWGKSEVVRGCLSRTEAISHRNVQVCA